MRAPDERGAAWHDYANAHGRRHEQLPELPSVSRAAATVGQVLILTQPTEALSGDGAVLWAAENALTKAASGEELVRDETDLSDVVDVLLADAAPRKTHLDGRMMTEDIPHACCLSVPVSPVRDLRLNGLPALGVQPLVRLLSRALTCRLLFSGFEAGCEPQLAAQSHTAVAGAVLHAIERYYGADEELARSEPASEPELTTTV